jgi:hypothetical protein
MTRIIERRAAPGEEEPIIVEAWRTGQVVVRAVPSVGPDSGYPYCFALPRRDFELVTEAAFEEPLDHLQPFCRAMRRALLETEHDVDFLQSIVIACTLSMIYGDSALEGSGLELIGLAIDPDASKPWHERGMLDPRSRAAALARRPAAN